MRVCWVERKVGLVFLGVVADLFFNILVVVVWVCDGNQDQLIENLN